MEKTFKCWRCGDIATTTRTLRNDGLSFYYEPMSLKFRCYCKECKEFLDKQEKEDMAEYVRLRKKVMFNKACNILENQSNDMYAYKEAIEVVQEKVETCPDKFDSSYEVLTAIVLVHNRIYSKMQYKIGKYQVDFLLPEVGVVLEIDGDRHKHRKDFDKKRDEFIKNELGYGWDIIRIKTEYLDMNARKIPDAINAVVEYRETNHIPWRKI